MPRELELPPQPAVRDQSPQSAKSIQGDCHARHLLELRLILLFTTEISRTLPSTYQSENLQRWTINVPLMALDHEPLRYALFSISILYILLTKKEVPVPLEALLAYRAEYTEGTLTHHRQALDVLNADNADQSTYTSALLAADALACLRDRPLDPYEPPNSWLQMSQGAKSVAGTSIGLVQGNPRSGVYSLHHTASSICDRSFLRSEANRSRFSYLLHHFDPSEDKDDAEVYTDAACFIAAADIAREAGEQPFALARRIIIFPCFMSPRFVQLVSLRRPRALAILAHLFGLALCVGDCWFIGKTPFREIMAIERFLGSEWRDYMAWPMDMIQTKLNKGS